ncbi:hypothetical protein QFZ96_006012 [Paraburkholderia youngii]
MAHRELHDGNRSARRARFAVTGPAMGDGCFCDGNEHAPTAAEYQPEDILIHFA